ncbi:tape measure protein [Halodurantibacterium flavum]|uniref:Tape measure protein n=1 Tax=Halodurantibacterium flavum TaxID=1382802 RepID=A0ABW4S8L4_9RHOB
MAESYVGQMRAQLRLDSTQFTGGLRATQAQTAGFVRQMRGLATQLAGAFGLAFGGRAVMGMADSWSDMQARVGLAVGEMDRAPAVMARIADMARRTYSDLGQTAESFLANATSLRELGYSTRQQLDYTEALNNALVVSGARGQRAESVTNALSKAMALGKLSGDNLNTVIANGGRLSELLAAHLGVTTNELRRLGSEGKITSQVIYDALSGSLEQLREEAASMPATIGDAVVLIRNSMTILVGTFDQAVQGSATLAEGLILLADNLGRIVSYVVPLAAFMAGRWVAAFVAARAAAAGLTVGMYLLRAAIISTGIGLLVVAAGELIYQFSRLVHAAGGFGEAMELLGDVAREVWDRMVLRGKALVASLDAAWQTLKANFVSALSVMAERWADFTARIAPALRFIPGMQAAYQGLMASSREASGFADTERELRGLALASEAAADALNRAAARPMESIAALREVLARAREEVEDGSDAANRLNDALAALGDGSGGGSAATARDGVDQLKDSVTGLGERMEAVRNSMQNAFVNLVTGANTLRDVIGNLLNDFARMLANQAFMSLWGAAFGTALAPATSPRPMPRPSFAAGTSFAPGGWARVNEQGGEIMHLPRGTTVIPHDLSKRMIDRGPAGSISPVVNIDARGAQVGVAEQIDAVLQRRMPDISRSVRADVLMAQRRGRPA